MNPEPPTVVIPSPTEVHERAGRFEVVDDLTVGGDEALLGPVRRPILDLPGQPRLVDAKEGRAPDVSFVRTEPHVAAIAGVSPTGEPVDESYRLVVSPDGVVIGASEPAGAWRAAITLRQLLTNAAASGRARSIPAIEIIDAPRFAWRGLSLDVVRCFHPRATVKRVIDLLAYYKLNVLHLHLSDDQGWRLEIDTRPELTAIGATGAVGDRPGGYYSRSDWAELVAYAAERGVMIVPEIDMPGHAAAVIRSYPELSSRPPGAEPSWLPDNVLHPDQPGVAELVADVLAALAELAPGPFVHLGGDEAFGMDPDAYDRFVDAARASARSLGMRTVMWQEAGRAEVGPNDVFQHWISFGEPLDGALGSGDTSAIAVPDGFDLPAELLPAIADMLQAGRSALDRATTNGARIVLSPASHLYLDRPYAEPSSDPDQEERRGRVGLAFYPALTIAESFAWRPEDATAVAPHLVAGIEAAVWCETVTDADDLFFLLLPRLAGVAERAWSSAPIDGRDDWPEFSRRLAAHQLHWDANGWPSFSSSLGPTPTP